MGVCTNFTRSEGLSLSIYIQNKIRGEALKDEMNTRIVLYGVGRQAGVTHSTAVPMLSPFFVPSPSCTSLSQRPSSPVSLSCAPYPVFLTYFSATLPLRPPWLPLPHHSRHPRQAACPPRPRRPLHRSLHLVPASAQNSIFRSHLRC
jgi:hypothetical protein